MIALTISFILGIKLRVLMGRGRDTGPVRILIILIAMNGLLGLQFLVGGYLKYLGNFTNYMRMSDVTVMVIGVVLSIMLYKLYMNYSKLIKKHEPSA